MSSDGPRRVLAVTGNRADYDLLQPVLQRLHEAPRYNVGVAVTGAHLSPTFGSSVQEVERDGYRIVTRIHGLIDSDALAARARSAAVELLGLTEAIERFDPSFVIVLGDREEALAGAIAGAYSRRPVVHIGGGDTADDGNIDNAARHAITRFAHLHLAATAASARRLASSGEEPWRIHHIGATGIDRLMMTEPATTEDAWRQVGATPPEGPYVLVVQHPTLMDAEDAATGMNATLTALAELDIDALIGRPNSDPGNSAMAAVIDRHVSANPRFLTYRNLDRATWVRLLRDAAALVGNSSAGIIEAPALHLPVVNVGIRQRGREHASNVVFVDAIAQQIRDAVLRAVFDTTYRKQVAAAESPYGDGHAAERAVEILDGIRVDAALLSKRLTF